MYEIPVAGFDYRILSAAIFAVCIANSSMVLYMPKANYVSKKMTDVLQGGLKAILWSNAIQCVVMMISMISLVICGFIEVGGVQTAWDKSKDTQRIKVFKFN
jgi:hypothetical protein